MEFDNLRVRQTRQQMIKVALFLTLTLSRKKNALKDSGSCTGMTESCKFPIAFSPMIYGSLYNNKINARVLIGQSAMVYCAGKPMEKSRVF